MHKFFHKINTPEDFKKLNEKVKDNKDLHEFIEEKLKEKVNLYSYFKIGGLFGMSVGFEISDTEDNLIGHICLETKTISYNFDGVNINEKIEKKSVIDSLLDIVKKKYVEFN